MINTEFLNRSFIKYQLKKSVETRMEQNLIKSQNYFSGMLMSIKPLKNKCCESSIFTYI